MAIAQNDVPGVPIADPVTPLRFKLNGTMIAVGGIIAFLAVAYFPRPKPAVDPTPAPVPIVDPVAVTIVAPVTKMTTLHLPDSVAAGSRVWWLNPDPTKLQVIEYGDHAILCPQVAGQLHFAAETYNAGAFKRLTWAIDAGKGPIPPPVDPVDPDPKPPAPIPPVPSPLQKTLQAAYSLEVDPAKATQLAKLAATLSTVVDVNKATGKIKTEKDMQIAVKAANDSCIGPNALPKVRAAIGAYLVPILGTNPNAPADAAFWTAARDEYATIAAALKGLK